MTQFFAQFRADAAGIRERTACNTAGSLRAPGDGWIDTVEALVRAGADAPIGYADDLPGSGTGLRGAAAALAYMEAGATHQEHPLAVRWEAGIKRLRGYFAAAVATRDGRRSAPWPVL